MEHPLQTTVNRLPELLEKNAPAMMRRMVAHMKAGIAERTGAAPHGELFLKVGEEDLVRQFVVAIRETFGALDDISLLFSLEPEGVKGPSEFTSSAAAFDDLCRGADALGIKGVKVYRKDSFATAMKSAFAKARMDERAIEELLPFANAALNAELQVLYAKLAEMARR